MSSILVSGLDVAGAAVVVAAVVATAVHLETSDNCYDAAPLYVGSAPDGLFLPSDFKLEAAAVWAALATVAAAVFWPPSISSISFVVAAWAIGSAALSSIANVDCEDDQLGPAFWVAHIALTAAPWVMVARG